MLAEFDVVLEPSQLSGVDKDSLFPQDVREMRPVRGVSLRAVLVRPDHHARYLFDLLDRCLASDARRPMHTPAPVIEQGQPTPIIENGQV